MGQQSRYDDQIVVSYENAGRFRSYCDRLMGERGCLVAVNDQGSVVGYCLFWDQKFPLDVFHSTAVLSDVFITDGYRGMGIGTELATTALSMLKERGFDRVLIRHFDQNTGAGKLYRSLGFESHIIELMIELDRD